MSVLMDIIGSLGSGGVLGGILGLGGTIISKYEEAKKREHELKMAAYRDKAARMAMMLEHKNKMDLARLTAASQEKIAEIDAAGKAVEQDGLNMRASFDHDNLRFLTPAIIEKSRFARVTMAIVETWRACIRPLATTYSLVLLTGLLWWVTQLYLDKSAVFSDDLVARIVVEVVFTTTTLITGTTLWWFGIRPQAKR